MDIAFNKSPIFLILGNGQEGKEDQMGFSTKLTIVANKKEGKGRGPEGCSFISVFVALFFCHYWILEDWL